MARASGWTVLSKLTQLVGLLVIVGVLSAGFLLPYIGGAGLAAKAGADKFLNTTCNLTEEPVQQKTTMYANDGKTVIATLFDQNRQVVSLSQIPKTVTEALIATEDRRFYQHHGVDLRGLIRGALKTSGGDTQGASTLTEQYVKQVRYYEATTQAERDAAIEQNVDRKILDAQCAIKIEKENTKNQILEKYLNIAFFGANSYGIQTAAQTYFGVDASHLTVPQAALLVGMVKAPSNYNPYEHPQAARERRDIVIDNMLAQKYISPAQDRVYKATPVKVVPPSLPPRGCAYANPKILNVGFFCDYALSWLENTGGLTDQKINTAGLKIVTTIDPNLQNQGQNNIWTQSGLDPAHSGGYILALPSMKPQTGEVTSMITDLHYGVVKGNAGYSVNPIFTQPFAGAGSTYKYFTALTALKMGVPTTYSLTTPNNQYTTKNCPKDPSGKGYTAHNAGYYRNTLPLSQALPESSNTYFVAMEDELFGCNLQPIVQTALGLGMNALNRKPDGSNQSYAQQVIQGQEATFTLGQEQTSVLEETGAFSALANDGIFCPPVPIKSVTDANNQPVSFKRPGCSRQYDSFTARTLVNIMTNDTHSNYGTAGGQFGGWYGNGGSLVAAKTGTNNSSTIVNGQAVDDGGNSALWFVGITPNLTSAAALINPLEPNKRIANVPGITVNNEGTDTFGATAAKFWLMAYQPTLINQHWDWPTPDSAPGQKLPFLTNSSVENATTQLTSAGYKVKVLPYACGSQVTAGNVAFYGPQQAETGATISLCLSSGVAPVGYTTPPTTTSTPSPTGSQGGGASSGGGTGTGGGGGGAANGGGGGRIGNPVSPPPHHHP
ncbi:MAG TPA: transglycosylase domain-containing protein [Jatrophihabitans sp.]|nr:transglycosylase domain-containing protein [Jatrophihabitans sp.]